MTETTYPDFGQYRQSTAAYLRTLLQPYHDALAAADSMEALTQWIPLVLPESAEDLNAAIAQLEVPQAKLVVLQTLASALISPDATTSTPWDLVKNRNEIAVRLFGPSSETVPVTVIVGPNSFNHDLTEEQTYGILVGLDTNPEFTLFISGAEISRQAYDDIFMNEDNNGPFVATVNDEEIAFGTPGFVQGVITAAEWINQDPHNIITKLVQLNDDTETPLSF